MIGVVHVRQSKSGLWEVELSNLPSWVLEQIHEASKRGSTFYVGTALHVSSPEGLITKLITLNEVRPEEAAKEEVEA